MEALRDPLILGSLILYTLLCLSIGLWAMRRTKSVNDFFMAGRDLGLLVTGVAMFSTTMSGFGFVGGPGLVYAMGMSSVWILLTTTTGRAIGDFLVAKRLRLFAELFDAVSLPDVVAARYGSTTTTLLTAVAILLGIMGYLATQMLAMALVLQSLLANLDVFSEIGLLACVAISCSVLLFYSVTGGIVASVYTDLVQGSIMVVAGVLVFITSLAVFDGGAAAAMGDLMRDDPESLSPWGTLGMIGCLSWYFMFAVGGAGQPHVITKTMMTQKIETYRYIPIVVVVGYTLTALLWVGIGLAMRGLVVQGVHPELASPDAAAPVFLQTYAHPVLAGVVFAGLFSAIMSTADAFLNIGTAALVHDIPKALRGRSLERELLWARIGTVALAIAAATFALYSHFVNERLVALLGAFGWGTFGAALVPAVAIGLNWKRATPLAVSVAILASLVINFGIELFDLAVPHGIHGGTLALIVSLTLFFTISFASQPPRLAPELDAVMAI
jgi:Na+/proline symporter